MRVPEPRSVRRESQAPGRGTQAKRICYQTIEFHFLFLLKVMERTGIGRTKVSRPSSYAELCRSDVTQIWTAPSADCQRCSLPVPKPPLHLGRGSWFRKAVLGERDYVHFGVTVGAPGDNCLCPANDHQRLRLNGDSGCSQHHGSLRFVHHCRIPLRTVASCADSGIKSL